MRYLNSRRYLNSSMTSFLSDILLAFPNLNDLNSRDKTKICPKIVENITTVNWGNFDWQGNLDLLGW